MCRAARRGPLDILDADTDGCDSMVLGVGGKGFALYLLVGVPLVAWGLWALWRSIAARHGPKTLHWRYTASGALAIAAGGALIYLYIWELQRNI